MKFIFVKIIQILILKKIKNTFLRIKPFQIEIRCPTYPTNLPTHEFEVGVTLTTKKDKEKYGNYYIHPLPQYHFNYWILIFQFCRLVFDIRIKYFNSNLYIIKFISKLYTTKIFWIKYCILKLWLKFRDTLIKLRFYYSLSFFLFFFNFIRIFHLRSLQTSFTCLI